jgi:hypothetical protein
MTPDNRDSSPHLYPFATYLATRFECRWIISIGSRQSGDLGWVRHPLNKAPGWEAAHAASFPIERDALRRSVIVCEGRVALAAQPDSLLADLHSWLDDAPVALLTSPEDDRLELNARLIRAGLRVEFLGLTAGMDGVTRDTILAVLANNHRLPPGPAPDDFRVIAIMRAYNEADIVVPSIRYLAGQGVGVYVIDNWSTDGTYELVEGLSGQGVVGVERYPPGGPSQHYEHKRLMERIEVLSRTLEADWFIHHDADEIRESPWPGVSLRDALYHVDRCGFNSVDHAVLDFFPVDDSFQPGTDFAAHFTYYEFGRRSGHFKQIKTWKNVGQRISLYPSGGHQVEFKGQRIYPYLFLIRHYPLRTSHQAVAKIRALRRRARRLARLIGWHHQYDRFDPGDARLFDELCGWARRELEPFDPATFYTCHLVERLSRNLSVVTMPSRWKRYVPHPALQALRALRRRLTRFL